MMNVIISNPCTWEGTILYGPRQVNLVLIAYASSEGSGEPAHPRSLARTLAARGERGGSVVECRTQEREVRGSRPTAAVLCP